MPDVDHFLATPLHEALVLAIFEWQSSCLPRASDDFWCLSGPHRLDGFSEARGEALNRDDMFQPLKTACGCRSYIFELYYLHFFLLSTSGGDHLGQIVN
jgi:hypothetical protein